MHTTVQLSTRTIIRNHLMEELVSFNESVPDDALLEDHDLDSEQIVALVLFLEEQFHIHIGDEEITTNNLGSLHALIAFVDRKTNINSENSHIVERTYPLEEVERYA